MRLGMKSWSFLGRSLVAALIAFSPLRADETYRFPDVRDKPKPNEHVFQLSQRYPSHKPESEDYPWLKFDFRKEDEWERYLRSSLSYAREGNDSDEIDWDVVKNEGKAGVRQWYHAPWMHWGRNGREYMRGLTHERVATPGDLHPKQTSPVQNWAVSLYNPAGGYVIGQVWADPDEPNPAAGKFCHGAMSIKLLFTSATEDQVPYLKQAKSWDADIYESIASPTNPRMPRKKQKVRLLQIDIAIRDSRADFDLSGKRASGWVFGTLVYNGFNQADNVWDRFEPIGVMWGNDEGVTVKDVREGARLQQTLTTRRSGLPFQHLGWAGRLNGPVDNPTSSCISCHATAQVHSDVARQAISAIPKGDPDSDEWMKWFKTIAAGQAFNPEGDVTGWESVDYSLQLSQGIANFREWKAQTQNRGGVSTAPSAPASLKVQAAHPFKSRNGSD